MGIRIVNLIHLLCIVAVNLAFLSAFSDTHAAHWLSDMLPIFAANALIIVSYIATRVALGRRNASLKQLARAYQSLKMLSEDRETEARILETISTVSADFLDKLSLRPLLERISEAIHTILDVDISIIEVLGDDDCEAMRFLRGTSALALDEKLYSEVVHSGRSLLINKQADDPDYPQIREQGLQSLIATPLTLHARTIGLIAAGARTVHGFTSRDLRQIQSFASHAALLIEMTQLLNAVGKLSVKKQPSELIGDLRDLKEHLSSERRLTEREMDVARKIQMDLLPRRLPSIANLVIEGSSIPAKEVGGDYYDVIELGDGKWGIVIADVSGKGVPASLVMVMTRTLLHALARGLRSPAELLADISADLFHETDPTVFVSMLYGIWDSYDATFTYANAGHDPPMLARNGVLTPLKGGGIALGVVEDIRQFVKEESLQMIDNDSLFLFTDGATEATNSDRELFGRDRLSDAFIRATQKSGHVIPEVLDSIRRFTGDTVQSDDITMITLNVVPQPLLKES